MLGGKLIRKGLSLLGGSPSTAAGIPAKAAPPPPLRPASPYLPDYLTWPQPEMQAECRRQCRTAYLGEQTLLCWVLGKYLLHADTADLSLTPHLALSGFWESWITHAVARVIGTGWNCVDVGANHGYYTLLLADAVGPAGRVVACEPNPRLADLLGRTLEVNGFLGRSQVVSAAVAEADGQLAHLAIPQRHIACASIQGDPGQGIPAGRGIPVRTVTLDTLCQPLGRVDFVKIDAEGAEPRIWEGMRQTVRRNPGLIILMEFVSERYAEPERFLTDLEAEGFLLRHVDVDGQIKPVSRERILAAASGEYWMLWLKRD